MSKLQSKSIFLLFFSFVLLFASCRKEKAFWNSDWVVPLVNDSLTLLNAIEDTILAINGDNTIQVIANKRLVELDLTKLVEIPDTTIEQTVKSSLNSIQIDPGFTFINQIEEHDFALKDIALKEIRVKYGLVEIELENPIETDGIFTVSIPGAMKANGEAFVYEKKVKGGTIASPQKTKFTLELTDYTIDLRGEQGNGYNLLQSKLIVKTDVNGKSVTLTPQHIIKFRIKIKDLKIDYAMGSFGNTVFSDTTDVDLDFLRKITGGALNLDDIDLTLSISNGVKVRAKGEIGTIESTNQRTGNIVNLNHPNFSKSLYINKPEGYWDNLQSSKLDFHFDQSTGNLKEFIENLGDKYKLVYALTINPDGNASSGNDIIFPKSRIGLDIKANFPLRVGVQDLTLQDTFAIDFKNDSKLLQVHSGDLILKTINTFPYGVEVNLSLLDEDGEIIGKIPTKGKVKPATTNVALQMHEEIREEVVFTLTKELAEKLGDTKYILITARFNSTHFNNNILYSNAALKFLLKSRLSIKSHL